MSDIKRKMRVNGVRVNHPRRPEPSYVTIDIELSYLRGEPVEQIPLTEADLIRLIEQAATALRILRDLQHDHASG